MSHAARASKSSNNLFWSQDLGPVHLISLNSYSQTNPGSRMYKWLVKDLEAFERRSASLESPPWLVVMMHVPWYSSNLGHLGEASLMKEHMEDLFYQYGVSVVLNGHVHSYERTEPIYRNQTDPCGPVYLNLGDGGNREGSSQHWLPGENGQQRPDWSAFRQASFGVAELNVVNASHAEFRLLELDSRDPFGGVFPKGYGYNRLLFVSVNQSCI